MDPNFQGLINTLIEDAKTALTKSGYFAAMAFIVTADADPKIAAAVPMTSEIDKERMLACFSAGWIANIMTLKNVFLVSDVAFRVVNDRETAEYILGNWDTECPATYPDSLRQNAIFFSHMDLDTEQTTVYLCEYLNTPDGPAFKDLEAKPLPYAVGMSSIYECTRAGYKESKKNDEKNRNS